MPQGKWIAGGFLVLFVALPVPIARRRVRRDVRILIAAILIMPAFLVLSPTRQMIGFLPPLVLSVIALLNAGYVATVWLALSHGLRLPKIVLCADRARRVRAYRPSRPDPPTDFTELPIFHAPVLAVHYAKAFVPSLFTILGSMCSKPALNSKRLDITDAGLL